MMNLKRTLETDDSEMHNKKKSETTLEAQDVNVFANSNDENDNKSAEEVEQKKYFNGVEISKLTKRQMKKYQKTLKWEAVKKEKRAKERLRTKEKRIQAKINNIDLGPSRKELKRMKMCNSPCKISVCIDLSFDDLMIDKDMAKTIKQVLRVYTENRRAKAPMQLYLTSFEGRSKREMERHHGYEHWDINFCPGSYLNVFPKERLIYLTSESDNIIEKLEDDKVYIIGGLVDHNFHKGLCFNKAVEEGIAHGQLPIGEYFWMKHRKVFTINQVFEILLRVSEGKNFKEAFEMILPKRIEMKPTKITQEEDDEKSEGNEQSKENDCKNNETTEQEEQEDSKKMLDVDNKNS